MKNVSTPFVLRPHRIGLRLLCSALLMLPSAAAFAYPFAAPLLIRADSDDGYQRIRAVTDFDKDGRADVLVSIYDILYWMKSAGNGTFTQAGSIQLTLGSVDDCVTGDFDCDGDVDVALYTRYDVGVVVLRNNGGFSFTKVQEFALAGFDFSAGIVLGDYDQDGDQDLGAFHYDSPTDWIEWFPNNGHGVFGSKVTTQLPNASYSSSCTGDFNRDGRMDLVTVTGTGYLQFRPGNPPGDNLPTQSLYVGNTLRDFVECADIDRDGFPDVLLGGIEFSDDPQKIAWCRWSGSGFSSPQTISAHSSGMISGGKLADLDEDGDLDVVFSDSPTQTSTVKTLMWAPNPGNGQFLAPQKLLDIATGTSSIATGDVDADGDQDIVFYSGNSTWVSMNMAIHRTAEFTKLEASTSLNGEPRLCRADVNGDGIDDLIWASPLNNSVAWTSGTYQWPAGPHLGTASAITTTATGVNAIAAGDVNHDGKTDVVMSAPGLGQLLLAKNAGSSWQISFIATLPSGTADIAIADVDADNHPDVVMAHSNGATLLRNTGGAGQTWVTEIVAGNLASVVRVHPVQFKLGGRMELLLVSREQSPARSRGYKYAWEPVVSAWQASLWFAEGDAGSALITTADFTRDGAADVLYATSAAVQCAANYNNGSMAVSKAVTGLPSGMRCATTADFNADGIADFVTAGAGSVCLAIGKGDGTFLAPVTLHSDPSNTFQDVVAYDFERDGDMDIAVAEANGDKLRILRNHLGHFDLTESVPASVQAAPAGSTVPAMSLLFTHGGRAGDAGFSIRSLRLRFLKAVKDAVTGTWSAGDGLTTEEAQALTDSIEVYRDLGQAGVYEAGTDPLIGSLTNPATSIGYFTITPTSNGATLLVAGPGQSVRLFVRVKMDAAASSAAVRSFFVEHITITNAATMVAHGALTENWRLTSEVITEATTRLQVPGQLESWRLAHWNTMEGAGPAANDADPDHDGEGNLTEYLAGSDPTVPNGSWNSLPVLQKIHNSDVRQIWLNLASPPRPDVTVTLEFSETLGEQDWKIMSTRIGAGAWTGSPSMQSIQIANGVQKLLLVDGPPLNPAERGFYRLRVRE